MRLALLLEEATVEGTQETSAEAALWLELPIGAPLEGETGPQGRPWEPLDPVGAFVGGLKALGSFCLVSPLDGPLDSPLDDALCATVLPLSARIAL